VKKWFIALFVILLVMPMVSAAPPITTVQQIQNGYNIIDSPQSYISLKTNYQYNFFVNNISNGALKDNTTTSCIFYLANKSGEVIFYSNVPYFSNGHWGIDINGGNFSELGFYAYGTRCNSTTLAGSISGLFEVTKNGFDSASQNFYPLIISIISIILILLTLAFILHQDHGILAVGFAGIGFYMLVPLLNTANMALENSYYDSGISGMIGTITTILTWMDYVLIIYIIVYIFIKVISGYNQDAKEKMEGLR